MTKNNVLAILMKSDGFVSGEAISRDLGLSRTAVNMAVKKLREEGYEIKSVTNRGYLLVNSPDLLSRGALMGYLSEMRMRDIECYDVVGSTNYEMSKRAVEGAHQGTVIVADEQLNGRGRKGRSFSSPGGHGIYLTYLMRPSAELKKKIANSRNNLIWSSITAWTSVTVAKVIEQNCGVRPDIKWVNDLYMKGRKICGILTQSSFDAEVLEVQHILIGIGINVSESYDDFPKEIRDIAGSIRSETGTSVSRAKLTADLIQAMDEMVSRWPDDMGEYLEDYKAWNIVPGRDVIVNYGDSTETVHALRINDNFSLTVRDASGEEKDLISGDVSLKV